VAEAGTSLGSSGTFAAAAASESASRIISPKYLTGAADGNTGAVREWDQRIAQERSGTRSCQLVACS
jgi:hypothetical protein